MSYNTDLQNNNIKMQTIVDSMYIFPKTNPYDNLAIAIINGDITDLQNINDIRYIKEHMFDSCLKLTTVNLPNVISVEDQAFQNCTALTTVNLPNAISIGDDAFDNCSELTTINLPRVTSINDGLFASCDKLINVNLSSVITIGSHAFSDCSSLVTIDLPNVTFIGSNAFADCTSLQNVILRSKTMVSLDGGVFVFSPINNNGSGRIYVPASLLELYRSAAQNTTYSLRFRAIEDYPEICG